MTNQLLALEQGDGSITNPLFKGTVLDTLLKAADPAEFIKTLLPRAIGLTFVFAVVIFFFMIVVGAIQWISSGGEKGALEAARNRITNSIVGIVILFSAYAVVQLIEGFFNVKILTIDIGPLVIQ